MVPTTTTIRRWRHALIAAGASVLMIGATALTVATAPPAHASTRVIASVPVFQNMNGGRYRIATLQVEDDGAALGAYMFHYGTTNYQTRLTSAHLCYLEYDGGPCRQRPGLDQGWYQLWAGPAVPWPASHHYPIAGYGWYPWRASGWICNNNRLIKIEMWSNSDANDPDADGDTGSGDYGPC